MSESGPSGVKEDESLFKRHCAKLLNLALLAYLALGTVTFNYLDQSNDPTTSNSANLVGPTSSSGASSGAPTLASVRLNSVRRMWNITNRLNILYEANWTALVLDELIEFERELIKSRLAATGERDDNPTATAPDDEKADDSKVSASDADAQERDKKPSRTSETALQNGKEGDNHNEKSSTKQTGRLRSMKKSFVHSLASITTIESPNGVPQSEAAKFFTILYGAIGIPLTFCTLSLNGFRLTIPAINLARILRHYLISVPVHYLCCACDFYYCIRLVSWCCCCCCCGYFCCPTERQSKRGGAKSRRGAPKLRLLASRTRGGATGRSPDSRPNGATPFAANSSQSQNCDASADDNNSFRQLSSKSVRFGDAKSPRTGGNSKEIPPGSDPTTSPSESPYSMQLFLVSAILLAAYLAIGAFIYAKINQTTTMDALYSCYSMLSASKLPDSFSSIQGVQELYNTGRELKKARTNAKQATSHQEPEYLLDPFIVDCIYLFCGLNLISLCAHYARLWLGDKLTDQIGDFLTTIGKSGGGDGQAPEELDYRSANRESLLPLQQQGNQLAAAADGRLFGQLVEPPTRASLTELFVVNPESIFTNQQQQLNEQNLHQQNSELSYTASDRSATANIVDQPPLCIHHRSAAISSSSHSPMYTSEKYLYLTNTDTEHHSASSHTPASLALRSSQLQLNEVRAAQTLNRSTNYPDQSYMMATVGDHHNHHHRRHSRTAQNESAGEQDTTTTTDSNTISSFNNNTGNTGSIRRADIVGLQHGTLLNRHHSNSGNLVANGNLGSIGFIFDPATTLCDNQREEKL